jgi:hypothetical protein
VVKLSHKHGILEVGFFLDEGGNHFWGIYPHRPSPSGWPPKPSWRSPAQCC